MANLVSPGVSTFIIDESFFIPGRVTTLPVIFIATADEKMQADGESPALGTFEHGLYREVTSVRQSIELYGVPRFIRSADGSPHHGDARNEYGLDALNKFLEIGNRAYVVRANVNLDDRIETVRDLWTRKIAEAGDYLVQLIEDYIEVFNAENQLFELLPNGNPNPSYKTSVDDEELLLLINEALIDVFDSYAFSSKERTDGVNLFAEYFLRDHEVPSAGFQEVVFQTTPATGNLTGADTTSLENDSTPYGVTVEFNTGSVDVVIAGEDAQTFSQLLDEINDQLTGFGSIRFASGRLRVENDATGVTSTVLIRDGEPSGTLPLFSNLTLFAGVSNPVNGTGPNPLGVFFNGYDQMPDPDGYSGLTWIIEDEFDPMTGFDSATAEALLLNAANVYSFTQEFRTFTRLGENDASRREEIVSRLRAAINDPNVGIRNPDAFNYNLVACPGYPEVGTELVRLAEDMLDEVFVLGETPFNKPPIGFNSISSWATSSSDKRVYNGIAYWFGHGLSSNIDGNEIMTSASSTALRILAFNDRERALWWAPAGTQRGQANHLRKVGYVSGTLGGPTSFIRDDLDLGARDSLYEFPKNINPITRIEGRGILALGQKTSAPAVSSRESINVERLLRFIKREVRRGVFPYLFEPNDQITRDLVKATVDNFLFGLINGRALYDFATICDDSNNTPDRIQRKELWIDIALKPVIAIEFIYVPIRVVSPGADIGSAGSVEASAGG